MTEAGPREGPDGIPIGRALVILSGIVNDDLREAVGVISQVHGDGGLPAIPMQMARLSRGDSRDRIRRGQIMVRPDTGEPIAIWIAVNETHRVFAALHEIGHLLDLSGIGLVGRFASPDSVEMESWREAIAGSLAMEQLVTLSESAPAVEDRRHAVDLLDPVEAWARSYAQYIVNRSGSVRLRASLDAYRTRPEEGVYYPQQWEDDDFGPIDTAIEELFRRLGWRRRPMS